MKPVDTLYRLSEPRDLPICKKLWAEHGKIFGTPKKLGWPTVVAERHGKILGFISTWPDREFVSPGPLITNGGSSPITTIRLIEAWENVVRLAGVSVYYFHVDKKNKHWLELVKKLGLEEHEKTKTGVWFHRVINNVVTQS